MQIDHFIKKISGLLKLFFSRIRNRPHKATREDVGRVVLTQAERVASSTPAAQGWGTLMELGHGRFVIVI